jgi:hypothetical protein
MPIARTPQSQVQEEAKLSEAAGTLCRFRPVLNRESGFALTSQRGLVALSGPSWTPHCSVYATDARFLLEIVSHGESDR